MSSRRTIKVLVPVFVISGLIGSAAIPSVRDQLKRRANTVLQWIGVGDVNQDARATFWCPMHPQIKRNKPDTCPICNMALVELEGGTPPEAPEHLMLTTQQIQQGGVVTEPVLRRALYREIDTTGRLAYDERRLATITSWMKGRSRIEKLHVNFTGEEVEQGALLAEVFNLDLIAAQSEYLAAWKADRSRLEAATAPNPTVQSHEWQKELLEAARLKLVYQGVTSAQIKELASSGKIIERIPILAPARGTVIDLQVREGGYVSEGDVILRLADLRHLWFFADIYEEELPFVSVGQRVTLTVRSLPAENFEGTVSFEDPTVDRGTRTTRVRIEIENVDGRLKPGMYARVRIHADTSDAVAVPANAVLWSGRRTVVLTKRAEGTFQPQEVRLGRKWLYSRTRETRDALTLEFGAEENRYHEVLAGLDVGQEIVTAGAFLLNAESQFQSVLTKMLPIGDQSATLELVIGESPAAGVRRMLEAYHNLSEALAKDQLAPVPMRAATLAQATEGLSRDAQTAELTNLAAEAQRVSEAARELSREPPRDLDAARQGFGRVSRLLVALLAHHGGSGLVGTELFVFECPMAGPFGYKLWLRPNQDMHNPYMGQKMLNCGTPVRILEPPAPSARPEPQRRPTTSGGTTSGPADGAADEVQNSLLLLPEEDRAAARAQEVCPVSGEPLGSMGKPVKVPVKGREVFLCCEGCRSLLTENPEKYLREGIR